MKLIKPRLWILGLALLLATDAARLLFAYRTLSQTQRLLDEVEQFIEGNQQ